MNSTGSKQGIFSARSLSFEFILGHESLITEKVLIIKKTFAPGI